VEPSLSNTRPERDAESVVSEGKLTFGSPEALRAYYQEKYQGGGYQPSHLVGNFDVSAAYHEARHKAALKLLCPKAGEVILDAACGDGRLSLKVAEMGAQVVAIDITSKAFESAAANNHTGIQFIESDLESITESAQDRPAAVHEGQFDKVVSVETLEHVLNPQTVIRNFFYALKPGGLMVVTYPTVNQTQMFQIERHLWGRTREVHSEHIHEWSLKELRQHFEREGFRYLHSRGIGFDMGPLPASLIPRKGQLK
jgi:2-polyprenyl-6-hydroxyphenyl methylase/3-demethylubiquinone-9 3-methyltransferase